MEQYFEITKKSNHYEEYFNYKNAIKSEYSIISKYKEDNNIDGDGYVIWKDYLYIENCESNQTKFGHQFIKNNQIANLIAIKKTSELGKKFSALNVTSATKPIVAHFFNVSDLTLGRGNTSLFDYKNKLYCSINCIDNDTKLDCPANFKEITYEQFTKITKKLKD